MAETIANTKTVLPDHNPEAERMVISSILNDDYLGDLAMQIGEVVKSHAYFSNDTCRQVYRSIQTLLFDGKPVDLLHITSELEARIAGGIPMLDQLGGAGAVMEFMDAGFTYPDVALSAATMVADCYHKRIAKATLQYAYDHVAKANGDLQSVVFEQIERVIRLNDFLLLETSPEAHVFQAMSLDDILAMPPKEWLIQDIIGKQDIAMMFGKEASGKTFVLIDMMFSAAIGGKWAGRFQATRPLKIAYCSDEGRAGLPERFKAAMEWYGPEASALLRENITIFLDTPQLFDKDSEKNTSRFIADVQAAAGNLDILFIDTLHNATMGANENDNGDAGIVIQSTKAIRDALGCATVFAHHVTKGTGTYRGASAYAGSQDMMIEISGQDNPRVMKCYKAKDAVKFEPIHFQLRPVEGTKSVVAEWLGDETQTSGTSTNKSRLMEQMKKNAGQFLTAKSWGESIGITSVSLAIRLLDELIQEHHVVKRLQNEDRQKSSRNPWIYGLKFIDQENELELGK